MTPVPVFVLVPFVRLREISVLPVPFLQISPVSLVLIVVPLVNVLVGPVFVPPALLVILMTVPSIAVLSGDRHRKNQGRGERDDLKAMFHDVAPGDDESTGGTGRDDQ
jgi:hypothetical protein